MLTLSTGHLNAQFPLIHDSTPAPDYPLVWSLLVLMGAQIPLQQNESDGLTNLRHHRCRGCLDYIQSTLPLLPPAAPWLHPIEFYALGLKAFKGLSVLVLMV